MFEGHVYYVRAGSSPAPGTTVNNKRSLLIERLLFLCMQISNLLQKWRSKNEILQNCIL
jgi:hypothetical protein